MTTHNMMSAPQFKKPPANFKVFFTDCDREREKSMKQMMHDSSTRPIVISPSSIIFIVTDMDNISAHAHLNIDRQVPPPEPMTECMNQCTIKSENVSINSSHCEIATRFA